MNDNNNKWDLITFICTIVLGFLYVNFVICGAFGIDAAIFAFAFILLELFYLIVKKVKLKNASFVLLAISLLSAINFMLYSNFTLKYINFLFITFFAIYWLYYTCGMSLKGKISELFVFDVIRMFLVTPFSNFIIGPLLITKTSKNAKIAKSLFSIFLGLIVAIPVTLIVIFLLARADAQFENIWKYISNVIFNNIFTYIFQFIIGIPIAFYFFACFYGFVTKSHADTLNETDSTKFSSLFKFVPSLISYTAILPLCVVYITFIVTQIPYFFSAFYNTLPLNYNFADYARRGFFELCAVVFINLCVILLMVVLTKRKDGINNVKGLRAYITIFSGFTLILIATALSKMFMYIDAYGLTLLRVYTSWFMSAFALTFMLIIIKQLFQKFNLARTLLLTLSLWFLVLLFANVDGLVANYNISLYQSGKFKTVDLNMTNELSDSAIPYIVKLIDDANPDVKAHVKVILNERKQRIDSYDNKWGNYNLSSARTKKILDEINLK